MPNTTIQLKKSSTPSAVPPSLEFGEIAINYADGKIYYKNTNSQIAQLITVNDNFGTVNANGVLIIADTQGDVFSLEQGSNIIIVGDAVNDKITISADLTVANTYAASVGAAANGWANTISQTRVAASNGWANTVGASDRDFANSKFLANTSGVSFNGSLFFPTGNVGIGITAPTSTLHVIGTANITGILQVGNTVNALDFNSTSDIKYKTDVQNIEYALDTVSKLRGVSFTWKESEKPSYGLIAQEVQNVIPEIVSTNNLSLSLNYDALIGHLVESIKELKSRIELLEKKVINKRKQS